MYNIPHKRNPTTLLVEDIRVSATVASNILRRDGHTVVVAQNGDDALRLYKLYTSITLVLMDINLPGKNGFEVTNLIRIHEHKHALPPVTVYALTGNTSSDYSMFKEAGINGCIVKGSLLSTTLKKLLWQTQCDPGGFAVDT